MQWNQIYDKHRKIIFFLLALAIVIIGINTVLRAAFFTVSRTDLTVYIRAAQAVWNHENIYAVENIRHWHYVYLPLLAILMVPFAFLPLGLSSALWYSISMGALIGTCKGLASFFESKNTRFWIPFTCIIVAIPPLLNTLTRGQLGTLSLYLTLLPFLLDQRGKKFSAGFILGFGIILKMSPLMILPFYFLLQKNWRALAGCICGGFVFGPSLSFEYLKTYFHTIAEASSDRVRQSYLWDELFTPFASDNQSFFALFTRFYWKNEINFLWKSNLVSRLSNLGLMASLMAGITGAYFFKSKNSVLAAAASKSKFDFVIFSLLSCVMLFTSPITQPHHYTPLVLLAASSFLIMRSNRNLRGILISAMVISLTGFSVGILFEPYALAGWPFWSSLFFWITVLVSLLRKT